MNKTAISNIILNSIIIFLLIIFFILSSTNKIKGESLFVFLAILPILGYLVTNIFLNKNSNYPEGKKKFYNVRGIIIMVAMTTSLIFYFLAWTVCDPNTFSLCSIFVGGFLALIGIGLAIFSLIGYILLFFSQLYSYSKFKKANLNSEQKESRTRKNKIRVIILIIIILSSVVSSLFWFFGLGK